MIMRRALTIAAALLLFIQALAQSAPRPPKSVSFAGELISIDTEDRYERMDRELMAFTYSHTSSMLMLKRAGKYFPVIEPILREYGLPDDLKYFAVIESTLDPGVVSPAGAAGLWQFMPATARQYGLEVSATVDERFSVEKETEAACKYLKAAYARFGDWMTVAASYNAGTGAISKKLEEQVQSSAMELWMVQETSRYMYRLLAAKMLFENPAQFGFYLNAEDRYKPVGISDTVEVSESIDNLALFALEHGTTYAALKRANLWLRDRKLDNPSKKKYYIVIPEE